MTPSDVCRIQLKTLDCGIKKNLYHPDVIMVWKKFVDGLCEAGVVSLQERNELFRTAYSLGYRF